MQYIFNISTYIQVHASLATDITLSFSHFYITHFACTVSPLYGIFWTMICCLSPLGQVRSGVNAVAKISEDFRRGNELQGTRTVLRHHEWYGSPMRYPLLYSVSLSWIWKGLGYKVAPVRMSGSTFSHKFPTVALQQSISYRDGHCIPSNQLDRRATLLALNLAFSRVHRKGLGVD